ncbi:MAG TPA: hypothetical protein PK264_20970 [Hyphomicrobiaceae bacterium]|nr:hypothetical protein [Hyphomicrobiaceae bacterium]
MHKLRVTERRPPVHRPGLALLALLMIASWPSSRAHACACCVNVGERGERMHALSQFEIDELTGLRAVPRAVLVVTEAFPEDVKGITRPAMEPYIAAGGIDAGRFRVTITGADGRKGTLTLALPKRFLRREIDVPPHPDSDAAKTRTLRGNATLYKEWIFSGDITGDGIFVASTLATAKAELVLHGHGNGCPSGADFHHWTLVVKGRAASFKLHGGLTPPPAPKPK